MLCCQVLQEHTAADCLHVSNHVYQRLASSMAPDQADEAGTRLGTRQIRSPTYIIHATCLPAFHTLTWAKLLHAWLMSGCVAALMAAATAAAARGTEPLSSPCLLKSTRSSSGGGPSPR